MTTAFMTTSVVAFYYEKVCADVAQRYADHRDQEKKLTRHKQQSVSTLGKMNRIPNRKRKTYSNEIFIT
jgi:cytochrome c551/c552